MKKNIKFLIIILNIFLVTNVFAEDNCAVFGVLLRDINGAFNIFKILAPIIVVVTSIFDFLKAFTGKVEGEMNKAFKRLMTRFIFAAVLFFLPILLNFFLSLINPSYSTCIN